MRNIGLILAGVVGLLLIGSGIALSFMRMGSAAPQQVARVVTPVPTATLVPTTPPCSEEAKAFLGQIQPLARRWDDAVQLASSTSRISLAPQIASLQAIRREAEDLEPPPCATLAKQYLVTAMEQNINGYIAFLGERPDSEVQVSFAAAGRAMDDYHNEIVTLTVGVVPTQTPVRTPST